VYRRTVGQLPDSRVFGRPDSAEQVDGLSELHARRFVQDIAVADVAPGGGEQGPVAPQLQLICGIVPHPYGSRIPISRNVELPFALERFASDRVDRLDARVRRLERVEQERERRVRLLVVAEMEKRIEGEGGISHPPVAVVVVLVAADPLGERGGRGRCDRPRRVDEELEREDASKHVVLPRALVRPVPCLQPPLPGGDRPLDAPLDGIPRLQVNGPVVDAAQCDDRGPPFTHSERAANGAVLDGRVACVPARDRQRLGTTRRERDPVADLEGCLLQAVPEAWLHRPGEVNPPAQPLHLADELGPKRDAAVLEGHQVGDAGGPLRGLVRGL